MIARLRQYISIDMKCNVPRHAILSVLLHSFAAPYCYPYVNVSRMFISSHFPYWYALCAPSVMTACICVYTTTEKTIVSVQGGGGVRERHHVSTDTSLSEIFTDECKNENVADMRTPAIAH